MEGARMSLFEGRWDALSLGGKSIKEQLQEAKKPKEAGTVTIDVDNCARCEEDHKGLKFKEFVRPLQTSASTHWCMCPTSKEPILMKIVSDKE